MAEYIKRETAVRAVMAAKWVDGSDGAMAMEIVMTTPAADVAPVVRRKDCTHTTLYEDSEGLYCTNICGLSTYVMDDDYCSYGERNST